MKKSLMLLFIALMLVALATGCTSKSLQQKEGDYKSPPQQKEGDYYYPACYAPIQKQRFNSCFFSTDVLADPIKQIAKARQIEDENTRMATYLSDIEGSISDINSQTASAKAALQCYDKQFEILLTSVKRKKISPEKAQPLFYEILFGTNKATALLRGVGDEALDMETRYRAALATEEQELRTNTKKRSSSQVRATRRQLRRAQKSCDLLQASTRKTSKQYSAAESQRLRVQLELMTRGLIPRFSSIP